MKPRAARYKRLRNRPRKVCSRNHARVARMLLPGLPPRRIHLTVPRIRLGLLRVTPSMKRDRPVHAPLKLALRNSRPADRSTRSMKPVQLRPHSQGNGSQPRRIRSTKRARPLHGRRNLATIRLMGPPCLPGPIPNRAASGAQRRLNPPPAVLPSTKNSCQLLGNRWQLRAVLKPIRLMNPPRVDLAPRQPPDPTPAIRLTNKSIIPSEPLRCSPPSNRNRKDPSVRSPPPSTPSKSQPYRREASTPSMRLLCQDLQAATRIGIAIRHVGTPPEKVIRNLRKIRIRSTVFPRTIGLHLGPLRRFPFLRMMRTFPLRNRVSPPIPIIGGLVRGTSNQPGFIP